MANNHENCLFWTCSPGISRSRLKQVCISTNWLLHTLGESIPIADIAIFKTPRTTGRNLDILLRALCTVQKISKAVCKKTWSGIRALITSLCCMKRAHYSKCMLPKQDCVSFASVLQDKVFLFLFLFVLKTTCWFLRCSAGKKKIKISSSHWWRFQLATSPIFSNINEFSWVRCVTWKSYVICFGSNVWRLRQY